MMFLLDPSQLSYFPTERIKDTSADFHTCNDPLLQFEKFTQEMGDGWGLATDGKILFGSDGTSTLYQIDPRSLKGLSYANFT